MHGAGVEPPASRWPAVFAFTALGATTQLLWLTFAPVTSEAGRRYGVSDAAIGWLANVFPLWYVVLAIPAGILLDRRLGAGLALGAVLTAGGALIRLVGDGYVPLLAGQTLVAWAQPLVLNAITGVAHRYLAPDDRAKGIALASAGTFAGMIAAIVLSAAVSLPTALVVGAVVAVVTATGVLLTAARDPRDPRGTSAPRAARAASVRETWRIVLVRRVCVLVFVPFGVFTAITTWAETLLKPAGVSSDRAGVLLLVTIVAGVAGSAVLPVWASRRGAETMTLGAALAVTTAACAAMAVAPGFALGVVAFGVLGFVLLATLPIVLELVGRAAGEAEGTAAGLVWLSGQLGALVVTGVVGTIVHHATASFVLLALATAAAAGPLSRLRTPTAAAPAPAGRPSR